MTSFIAACGSGCCISLIPAVPAAWSVTTIACMIISLRSFVSLLEVLRRELELALGGTVRRYTGARRNVLLDCGPSHYAAFFTNRGGKATNHSHESFLCLTNRSRSSCRRCCFPSYRYADCVRRRQ